LGFRSEIVTRDFIGSVRQGAGLIQIDLSTGLTDLSRADQLLAISQIVLTASEIDPEAVFTFTVDSSPIDIPLPNGSTTQERVGRPAYLSMVAPS